MILLPKSKPTKIKICSDIFNACLEHNSAYRYNTLILLFYYMSLFSIDIFQVHWLSFWADMRDWPAKDTCWGPDCPCLPWHPSDTPLTVPVGSLSSHQQVSQARSNINQIYVISQKNLLKKKIKLHVDYQSIFWSLFHNHDQILRSFCYIYTVESSLLMMHQCKRNFEVNSHRWINIPTKKLQINELYTMYNETK